MARIYTRVRRPVARAVNPLLLPSQPEPAPVPEPEPEPVAEYAADPEPSTDMSLKELQAMADEAGVPSYGTKADIVARLTDE